MTSRDEANIDGLPLQMPPSPMSGANGLWNTLKAWPDFIFIKGKAVLLSH
jgi:hypothetical protein